MNRQKERFLSQWDNYIDGLTLLGNSTKSEETWKELKRQREKIRKLAYKIADEKWPVSDEDKKE